MLLRTFLLLILILFVPYVASDAQTTGQTRNNSNNFQVFDGTTFDTPDYGSLGGCSVSGQMQYSGGTMRFCNGSTWRNLDSGVNNGGCSNAGQIRRNTTWLEFCNGSNWRKINPTHIDGACLNDGASNNLCNDGTANDGAISDTSAQWRWRCDGLYGGSNSGTCYKNKPVNGVCNNATRNACSAGTPNDGAVADNATYWRWRCDGQYGGSNSGTCQKNKPVNGVCNNATRNACSAGSSNDGAIADTTAQWRWRCDGQYGGSNSGTCAKNKASCSSTTISNCSLGAIASGSSTGSCAGGYSGSCSYLCNNGAWSANSNSCALTPVNGVCNNATRNACSAGTPNDGAIADTTAQWRWRCDGQNGGSNSGTCAKNKASCSATTISNCSLGATASGSSTGSCASGYSGSCSYLCNNSAWSANSNSCSAVPTPVNGVCNNSSRNACSAGVSNDGAISDTTTQYRWRCDGQNGGSNSGTCSIARPGVCGSAASGGAVGSQPSSNQCSYGTYQDLSDTGSYWRWRCNGNPNSPTCQRARITAVNGSCGSADGSSTLTGMPSGAAACSAGTRTNTNTTPIGMFTSYTWDCAGSGGGSTASCSGSGSSGGGGTCTGPTGGTLFDGMCGTYSGHNCEYHCCGGVLTTQNCQGFPYTFDGICAANCP